MPFSCQIPSDERFKVHRFNRKKRQPDFFAIIKLEIDFKGDFPQREFWMKVRRRLHKLECLKLFYFNQNDKLTLFDVPTNTHCVLHARTHTVAQDVQIKATFPKICLQVAGRVASTSVCYFMCVCVCVCVLSE